MKHSDTLQSSNTPTDSWGMHFDTWALGVFTVMAELIVEMLYMLFHIYK